jgi:predicted peptidase
MKIQMLAAAICGLSSVHAEQVEKVFQGKQELAVGYRYLLALPEGYETDTAKRWPLIVFLHGAGERGEDLKLLLKHGPPKLIDQGKDLGAIVVSPQVPTVQIWEPHGVKALTDEVTATLRVDKQRIYLTGISMGGFGTWETAFAYPDTYAAIVPICGGTGVRWLLAERLKHLPAWIFHGAKDTVVPPENSEKIHAALKKSGSHARMTIYPDAGHDSWTAAYADPELWLWLMQQQRVVK